MSKHQRPILFGVLTWSDIIQMMLLLLTFAVFIIKMSDGQSLIEYKVDQMNTKLDTLIPALNRLETRVTILEAKGSDGSATLR